MSRHKRQIWGNHLGASPDELMLAYCAGRDVLALPMADAELLPFDLWTNRAHAIMLQRQGIIAQRTLKAILKALAALESEWEAGRFALDPALEDVHVNVERYVSSKAGEEAGGRLHTGRSRNDQVACDMRLLLREALLSFGEDLAALAGTLLDTAAGHTETVMPGFTHHQPAMITTWGHWLCAYAQGLGRDLQRVRDALHVINRSPLGAAASFGTSWPIDRELTASLLGFARVEENTLDAIAARGELEGQAAYIYAAAMNHLAAMAQDLILLAHPYWDMLRLPDSYVTGSSIMPQKRNPDFAEVVKGKTAWVVGMVGGLLGLPKGAMSGYNRDSQISKYAILDVVRECQPTPTVLLGAFARLEVRAETMRARLGQGYLAAADFADALARALSVPFRQAYDITAAAVRLSAGQGTISPQAARQALQEAGHDPAAAAGILADLDHPLRVLGWRTHTGAPEPQAVKAQVVRLSDELRAHSRFSADFRARIDEARARCRA
ncbi:MAG: argininosuccinate lyase [Candidatus Lambdaproteobacteria bacterium]|nr:argininosuccinate lyase [Candidatus Lambdaproteobacteria bacterium]